MARTKRVTFRLTKGELVLLKEIKKLAGLENLSETLRLIIYTTYTLYKSGLYKIVRPIPELAEAMES